MKTLTKIAVPVALAALLAVPVYADHDHDGYRDYRDRAR